VPLIAATMIARVSKVDAMVELIKAGLATATADLSD
jgi:hypothetical protein